MNKNELTLIVPTYGKDPSFIFENLSTLCEKASASSIDVIIIYKYMDENPNLDYSSLEQLSDKYNNVKVIKGESDWLKTRSTMEGIKFVNTRYFQILDSHHNIFTDNLKELNNRLKITNKPLINNYHTTIDIDNGLNETCNTCCIGKFGRFLVDLKKEWFGSTIWAGVGVYIINTDFARKSLYMINDDIILFDDITIQLAVTIQTLKCENKLIFENIIDKIELPFYRRIIDSRHSNTANANHDDDSFKKLFKKTTTMFEHMLMNLDDSNEFRIESEKYMEKIRVHFNLGIDN